MNNPITSSNVLTRYQRRALGAPEIVLGTQEVPASFTASVSHSYDFRNLIAHIATYAQKNNNLVDKDRIYLIKSKMLANNPSAANTWNDQYIIENVNKFSMFKENLLSYRTVLKDVLANHSQFTYFSDMRDASYDLTNVILKSVYYTEGIDGIVNIGTKLDRLVSGGGVFNPDCLRIYNLLIYSAPFILTDAFNSTILTQDMFFYAPYETIAGNLHVYIQSAPFQNLNFMLRMQLRIESNLPDFGIYHDSYRALIEAYRNHKLLGVAVSVTPIIVKYVIIPAIEALLTKGNPSDAMVLSGHGSTPTEPVLSPEDVEYIVQLMYEMYFNP